MQVIIIGPNSNPGQGYLLNWTSIWVGSPPPFVSEQANTNQQLNAHHFLDSSFRSSSNLFLRLFTEKNIFIYSGVEVQN